MRGHKYKLPEIFSRRWDSKVYASERKLQGLDYYQDYICNKCASRIFKIQIYIKGFGASGYKNYAEFDVTKVVDVQIVTSQNISNTLDTVNVTSGSAITDQTLNLLV